MRPLAARTGARAHAFAWCSALGMLANLVLAPMPAGAEDYYHGKSISLIVGFTPGGGVDTGARHMARHLRRFIPGLPTIVVQNMEGAGGIVAANFLDRRGSRDGLTIAVPGRSWYVEGIVRNPAAAYDATGMTYIGSSGTANTLLWVRSDTGIRSFEDLKRYSRKLPLAAIAPGTPTAIVPAMLAQNGVPVEALSGYGSTSRATLAIEQGEAGGMFTIEDSFATR